MDSNETLNTPILEKNRKIGNQSIAPVGDPNQTPDYDPNPPTYETGANDPSTPSIGGGLAEPTMSTPDLTPIGGAIEPLDQEPIKRTLGDAPEFTTSAITPMSHTVNDKSLVKTQMNSLLEENSKYLQLARTGAKQEAAARGLTNSSIAAGAGENAAIRNALPIAQQDAQTHFTADTNTVNAQNRFKENQQQSDLAAGRDHANAGYAQDNAILQGQIQSQAQARDHYNAMVRAQQAQGYTLQRDSLNAGYTQDNMRLQAYINEQAQIRDHANQLATLDRQAFIQTQRDHLLQGFQTLNLDHQQAHNLETIAANFSNQMEQNRFQVGAQFQQQYLQEASNLQGTWSAEIQAIYQNPNMTPEQQANAVAEATRRYQNQAQTLARMYAEMGAWRVVVEQFPTGSGVVGSIGGSGAPSTGQTPNYDQPYHGYPSNYPQVGGGVRTSGGGGSTISSPIGSPITSVPFGSPIDFPSPQPLPGDFPTSFNDLTRTANFTAPVVDASKFTAV